MVDSSLIKTCPYTGTFCTSIYRTVNPDKTDGCRLFNTGDIVNILDSRLYLERTIGTAKVVRVEYSTSACHILIMTVIKSLSYEIPEPDRYVRRHPYLVNPKSTKNDIKWWLDNES